MLLLTTESLLYIWYITALTENPNIFVSLVSFQDKNRKHKKGKHKIWECRFFFFSFRPKFLTVITSVVFFLNSVTELLLAHWSDLLDFPKTFGRVVIDHVQKFRQPETFCIRKNTEDNEKPPIYVIRQLYEKTHPIIDYPLAQ